MIPQGRGFMDLMEVIVRKTTALTATALMIAALSLGGMFTPNASAQETTRDGIYNPNPDTTWVTSYVRSRKKHKVPVTLRVAVTTTGGDLIVVRRQLAEVNSFDGKFHLDLKTDLNGEIKLSLAPGKYKFKSFYRHTPTNQTMSWWNVVFDVTEPGQVIEFSNDNTREILEGD